MEAGRAPRGPGVTFSTCLKARFYSKLRISAGMMENLKTINITLIPTAFSSTEMFKNVRIFFPERDAH